MKTPVPFNPAGSRVAVIDPRDIKQTFPEALDARGRLRVMPAWYWQNGTDMERAAFGHKNAAYLFPTEELVSWLRERIAGRSAIEVGSGNGVLAEALGIQATDNMLQLDPEVAAVYAATGQPVIDYGANVERLDAMAAIAKYRPSVVVASWLTHVYNPLDPARGGSVYGPDEREIIRSCDEYLFVGNLGVHEQKPVLAFGPHFELFHFDWIVSRASNGLPNFIVSFKRETFE